MAENRFHVVFTQGFRRLLMQVMKTMLAAGILGTLGLGFLASERILKPKRRPIRETQQDQLARPEDYGLTLTSVETLSTDGFPLEAWLIERADAPGKALKFRRMQNRMVVAQQMPLPEHGNYRGTIVMIHGFSGIKEHQFAIAERFVAAGFRCLAVENRAHGTSSAPFCTYGVREVEDVEALLARAREMREEALGPIGVFGISLGSTIAVNLMAKHPEIRAGVCVSAFADLREIVGRAANDRIVRGAGVITPLISLVTRIRAGFYLGDIRPEEIAGTLTQPVLMVHGEADAFTDISHGRRVFERLPHPESQWMSVPEGTHHDLLAKGSDPLYHAMAVFFYEKLTVSN